MWKPLALFSGTLLLVSAFAAHKLNEEITEEKQLLKDAQDTDKAFKAHRALAQKTLKDYTEQKDKALGDQKVMEDELAKSKQAKQEATLAGEEAATKLKEVETQKSDWDRKLADLGGLETIKQELGQLASQKAENEVKIQQRKATTVLNLQKKADQESALTALKKKVQMQSQGLLADTFTASVANVDPTAGFIMINKGNSANVVRNAKLDVVRGADKIATLIVRSVQPASSVCDVLVGTMAPGESVQAGDKLVVNSESSEKNLAMSTPQPAGAPAAPAAGAPAAPADPFGAPSAPADAPAAATTAPAAAAAPDPFAPTAGATPPAAPAAPAAAAGAAPDPFAPAPATNN